jgi:hypothetical protein
MPQAFYWVQASGAKGSNHTTDQCRSREDQRGSDQVPGAMIRRISPPFRFLAKAL